MPSELARPTPETEPGQGSGRELRELLGGDPAIFHAFPAKPKGMHWQRYERLQRTHDRQLVDGPAHH